MPGKAELRCASRGRVQAATPATSYDVTLLQETRVHLEPAETELNAPIPRVSKSPATHTDQPKPEREGLPAAFKMRRERHYVEQLMGDAPLRTVREIPIDEIEPPTDLPTAGGSDEISGEDLASLRTSIEELGILQPLLVSQIPNAADGHRLAIIAGVNRYRVARQLGMRTVPCLVCETSAHTIEALREAATRRAIAPAPPELPMPVPSEQSRDTAPAAGLREVTARLAFVSAVMPALDVAGYDPLRWNILTDLMKVEMERARSTAAAVEWLSSSDARPVRETVDGAAMIDAVLEAVGPEARLQGIKLDIESTLSGYCLSVDRTMMVRALIGLVQSVLALSPAGSTLRIDATGTSVRPAAIISVTQRDCEISDGAAERFFDAGFAEHPSGLSGALVLAGVTHVARLHGGRVHARAHETQGCTVTFVVPKPLSE
jgi:hypothetical protein